MQLREDKNGMTLIEIVVVLLISTIIMIITSAMILSSMGYFGEEVIFQQDQEGLDDISGYIRKELSYATDVRVATTKPSDDDWHWLSIQNGKLYKDDKQLLDDTYYQNRNMTCTVQGFDNYRLDIYLKYIDTKDVVVAKTRTSLELLNLKAEREIHREYAPFSTEIEVTEIQKIYYIIKEKTVEQEPEIDDSGTVKEQLKCLNNYNNRGEFHSNTKYYVGDYVFDDTGQWWVNVSQSRVFAENEKPGNSTSVVGWKKISAEFDPLSSYEKNDIVRFGSGDNMHYYQAKNDYIMYIPDPTQEHAWSDLGTTKPEGIEMVCHSLLDEQKVITVRNKLDDVDLTKILSYEKTTKYEINDIVKVINPDTSLIEYYLKVATGEGVPGSSASTGWQHVTRDFSEKSAYDKGDVVLYLRDGIVTIHFKEKMNDAAFDIETEILQAESYGGSKYIEIVSN